jgi:hypothetical protein
VSTALREYKESLMNFILQLSWKSFSRDEEGTKEVSWLFDPRILKLIEKPQMTINIYHCYLSS